MLPVALPGNRIAVIVDAGGVGLLRLDGRLPRGLPGDSGAERTGQSARRARGRRFGGGAGRRVERAFAAAAGKAERGDERACKGEPGERTINVTGQDASSPDRRHSTRWWRANEPSLRRGALTKS